MSNDASRKMALTSSDLTARINARALLAGCQCSTGSVGPQGPQGNPSPRGNVAVVDAVYGNDSTASIGGTPFLTVVAAIAAVSSGQAVWILPGTYVLTSGLTLKSGISIRGLSLQTTILQMSVTTSTTMLTMAESCRVEDLSFSLTCTGTATPITLKGIVFGGTSSQTSKLRTCIVTVNNSGMASPTLTSTVTGIEFSGTGSLTSSAFSFNSVKASTINVISNGLGNKRGILISGTNQVSTRDTNIYVAAPTDTTSQGSYIGVETADTTGIGSIQLRSTTVGIQYPSGSQSYTGSDILQSYPTSIINPTYLASPGIQVGPGTDLVTKSAGGKGFSTYIYPTTLSYGLKGNISSAGSGGYLWTGSQSVSAGVFPDSGLPAPYYRIQQPTLLSGLSSSLSSAPGGNNSLTLTIYYTPALSVNTTGAIFTGYISGTTLTVSTGPSFGTIVIGQSVSGYGIAINTYIISGSGSSWTVYPSQTVGSSGSTIAITNGNPASSFTASSSGTTLTVNGAVTGSISIGQYINGTGIPAGTIISGGSGTSWILSSTPSPVLNNTAVTTSGLLNVTNYSVTFGSGDTEKTFYNGSFRFIVGDRLHVYTSYTTNVTGSNPTVANQAHDLTLQLDMF